MFKNHRFLLLLSLLTVLLRIARESSQAVSAATLKTYPNVQTLDVEKVTAARELLKSVSMLKVSQANATS